MRQNDELIKMTKSEVKDFRFKLYCALSGSYSLEEKKKIEKRNQEIENVGKDIIKNNGGRNPILEY